MDDPIKKEKVVPEGEPIKPRSLPQEEMPLPEAVKEVLGGGPESQETKKQVIETAAQQAVAAVTPAPAALPGAPVPSTEEQQIEEAVNLAFTKGIENAIEQIKKSGKDHLLDAFHDKMVDELYQRLIQSGKLKQL